MARRGGRKRAGGGSSPAASRGTSGKPPAGAPARERPATRRGDATRRPTGSAERPSKPTASQTAWEWLRTLLGAFAIYFVVQAFLVQAFRIPSGSMEETLLVGDWLFVNKLIFGPEVPLTDVHLPALSEPERFGIVVFESPIEPGLNLVKRVIGVAGDTLAMREGRLILNGEPQDEAYVQHVNPTGNESDPGMLWQRRFLAGGVNRDTYRPSRDDWGPIVVPSGHFFMMGDNRDASFDSRFYGFVPRRLIRGEPLFIYYSYNPRAESPLPFLTAIRWDRIGQPIR